MMLRGSITAIITPFRNGELDKKAFDNLLEWQVSQGSHGIVACGTTGESPTLTPDEHDYIVRRSIEAVKGRIPVIAGTGTNSTAKTLELTQKAKEMGADAALIVAPYYNKPTQEGLYAHYRTVAEAVNIPVILYNIPGRSVVDIKTETMTRLAKIKNIVGVKDATGNLQRPKEVLEQIGPDFIQLSGDDATTYDFLAAGGHGAISVTSDIAPGPCAQMHNLWREGKKNEAGAVNERLMPLHKGLFCETSPAPVKYGLSLLGLCADEVRLPLVSASAAARKTVAEAMEKAGITLKRAA